MTESPATLVVSPLMYSGSGPPFLRLGGIARYRLDAVDRWLTELEHDHAPES